MQIVYTDAHRGHDPDYFVVRGLRAANPETPRRAESLIEAARAGGHDVVGPDDFGPAPRLAVHDAGYLAFLETAHARWRELPDTGPEVVPNMRPVDAFAARPGALVSLAARHMADTACPIGPGTWEAACAGANVAVHAAELVLAGAPTAYGLCRPPGHHAYADTAGGFCYLNNVAIAAQHMLGKLGRVAILDVDIHHGNGTQSIFYGRADVLFVSIHCDPTAFYPFFVGYAGERGEGAGEGANCNLPLAPGSGDRAVLGGLDTALGRIREHGADALIVSLGFDAYRDDPLSAFEVTTEGFRAIAGAIAGERLPTLLIQEGGYDCPTLGTNLAAFLEGFEGARP